MKIKLSPSIICAGIAHLEQDIKQLEHFNVDYLHVDVMDGHFVNNLFGGPEYIESLRSFSNTPLDIHLMIDCVENKLDMFNFTPKDSISFHWEATKHAHRVISYLKEKKVRVGIALNPATPISMIEDVLSHVDFVQILTINPGHAGQTILPYTFKKIIDLRKIIDTHQYNIDIAMDGSSDFSNIVDVAKAGANIIVIGACNCFAPGYSIPQAMERIIRVLSENGYKLSYEYGKDKAKDIPFQLF